MQYYQVSENQRLDTGTNNMIRTSLHFRGPLAVSIWVQTLDIFYQKFDKSSEPAVLDSRRDACNGAKWPQYNPYEMSENNFKISPPPKNSKNWFLGPKMSKMTKNRKFFEIFFWSESI